MAVKELSEYPTHLSEVFFVEIKFTGTGKFLPLSNKSFNFPGVLYIERNVQVLVQVAKFFTAINNFCRIYVYQQTKFFFVHCRRISQVRKLTVLLIHHYFHISESVDWRLVSQIVNGLTLSSWPWYCIVVFCWHSKTRIENHHLR